MGSEKDVFIDVPLIKALMAGYYSVKMLSQEEKENMIYAMQQFTLIYAVQHWVPRIDIQNWKRYQLLKKESPHIQSLF
jgi:hypothetical protein